MKPIIFLHIEKTAGTSLRKSVIAPHRTCRSIGPLRDVLVRGRFKLDPGDCVHGHVAYGHHYLLNDEVDYVTILREPVDRAVSFYYFVRDLARTDIFERHPLRDYADSVTLGQFFSNPGFQNIQTRRIAGIAYDRTYPHLFHSASYRRAMLEAAKRHLAEMPVFGLHDRYEESQRRFLAYVGGNASVNGVLEKRTKSRPTLQEIEAVRPALLDQLRSAHELDTELHTFATALFTREAGQPTRAATAGCHAADKAPAAARRLAGALARRAATAHSGRS